MRAQPSKMNEFVEIGAIRCWSPLQNVSRYRGGCAFSRTHAYVYTCVVCLVIPSLRLRTFSRHLWLYVLAKSECGSHVNKKDKSNDNKMLESIIIASP